MKENISRKEKVLDFVNRSDYTKITVKQLAVILGVPKEDRVYLENLVLDLEKQGKLYIDDSKRICKVNKGSQYVGRYETRANSFGFVHIEDDNMKDIYVAREDTLGALNGDIVLVDIIKSQNSTKSAEGIVKKILKRANLPIVGVYVKGENFGFVEPILKGMDDIYIPKKYTAGIANNARVVVKIEKSATSTRRAEGKILEVISSNNENDIERAVLIKSSLVPEKFSKEVLEQADTLSQTEISVGNRVDLRDRNIYTIDSEDTKDIDDAVELEKLDDGTYKLSVHIADVSNYVTSGSALDKEALNRGTSVYMPGFVIPMLPRSLSNGICSLNEGEDRYTLSIDMIIDNKAKVLFSNVYKGIICSKKKMTYENVEKVLNGEIPSGYEPFVQDLLNMKELAEVLKQDRKRSGSIDFDIPESKVILDDAGEVLSVEPYRVGKANDIIEEFMLMANKCIAKMFFDFDAPFIYRIHEKPELETLRELNEILTNFNMSIKGINKIHPRAISDVLDNAKDNEKIGAVVSKLVLRSMKLAKYSTECLGHFGLNFEYYTHFTSPIRRYPDLFIHRVISKYIDNDYVLGEDDLIKLKKGAKVAAVQSSLCEKRATLLERDVVDMYMAKYMKKHIGEEYEAMVSGINNHGMYVKLPNTVEGFISLASIEDDYYIYEEKNIRLLGEKTRKVYNIGDKLNIVVVRADEQTRQIDFNIVGGSYEKKKHNNTRGVKRK